MLIVYLWEKHTWNKLKLTSEINLNWIKLNIVSLAEKSKAITHVCQKNQK